MTGDWAAAQPPIDESVRLFRELGDQHQLLMATHVLAWTYDELGDRERARVLDEANVRRARALRNEQLLATTLDKLASYAVHEGRVEDAVAMATESLRIYSDLDDLAGMAVELPRCASVLVLKGEAGTAARLLASAEALLEEIGGTMPWVARIKEETLAAIREQLDEAAFAEAWEQGLKLTAGEAVALAFESLD